MKTRIAVVIILACILLTGCTGNSGKVTQFSTLNALMAGCYQGTFKCGDLSRSGDFGIGTFDRLDGEMVMLDGAIYQICSDGSVKRPGSETLVPFAVVTTFRPEQKIELKGEYSLAELQGKVDEWLSTTNIFYAVRIDGRFAEVRTRSVPAQQKPYKQLTEVVKNQPVFERRDVQGTLVGFRCPDYAAPMNLPGYHLHFISTDREFGGHLLSCRVKDPLIRIEHIREVDLRLPPYGDFDSMNMRLSDQSSLNKVEK